eukprot:4306289-Alexandrium_andersonii.AAC.1
MRSRALSIWGAVLGGGALLGGGAGIGRIHKAMLTMAERQGLGRRPTALPLHMPPRALFPPWTLRHAPRAARRATSAWRRSWPIANWTAASRANG